MLRPASEFSSQDSSDSNSSQKSSIFTGFGTSFANISQNLMRPTLRIGKNRQKDVVLSSSQPIMDHRLQELLNHQFCSFFELHHIFEQEQEQLNQIQDQGELNSPVVSKSERRSTLDMRSVSQPALNVVDDESDWERATKGAIYSSSLNNNNGNSKPDRTPAKIQEAITKTNTLIPRFRQQIAKPLPLQNGSKEVEISPERINSDYILLQGECLLNFLELIQAKTASNMPVEVIRILLGANAYDSLLNRISDLLNQKIRLAQSTNQLCIQIMELSKLVEQNQSSSHAQLRKHKNYSSSAMFIKANQMSNLCDMISLWELHFESLHRASMDEMKTLRDEISPLVAKYEHYKRNPLIESENGLKPAFCNFTKHVVTEPYQQIIIRPQHSYEDDFGMRGTNSTDVSPRGTNDFSNNNAGGDYNDGRHSLALTSSTSNALEPVQITLPQGDPFLAYWLHMINFYQYFYLFASNSIDLVKLTKMNSVNFAELGMNAEDCLALSTAINTLTFLEPNVIVVKDGWLYKVGEVVRNWKNRFFRLTTSYELKYYSSASSKQRGSVNLHDVISVIQMTMAPSTNDEKYKFCFQLRTADRNWMFSGDATTCQEWTQILSNIVQYLSSKKNSPPNNTSFAAEQQNARDSNFARGRSIYDTHS